MITLTSKPNPRLDPRDARLTMTDEDIDFMVWAVAIAYMEVGKREAEDPGWAIQVRQRMRELLPKLRHLRNECWPGGARS